MLIPAKMVFILKHPLLLHCWCWLYCMNKIKAFMWIKKAFFLPLLWSNWQVQTAEYVGLTHCSLLMPYGDIDLGQHWSGNGLLPDGTKPFPEPTLTYHHRNLVAFILFIWVQFYRKRSRYLTLVWVWKFLIYFNSLWPSDTIWQQGSGSTLAQVMACYLMAPSHSLNQPWFPHFFRNGIQGLFKDFSWTKLHFSSTMESLSSIL